MARTIDTTPRTVSVPDPVEVVDKKRYLLEVCDEVLHSSRFSTDSSNCKFFRESAEKIVSVENKEFAERFSDNLQSHMEKLFEKTLKLSKLWPAFQKYSLSDELQKEWKAFCDTLSLEMKSLFWQYITEEVFKRMLQAKVKAAGQSSSSGEADDDVQDVVLTFEEKNAINYIGGYIVKQLHSKIVTRKSHVDALLLLQSDIPTGLESSQWTETVDRGGLTHINEMFYYCLVAIEKGVQKLYTWTRC